MTQTAKYEVTPLARVAIKVSGIVIWVVRSESGSDYKVVVVDGKVSSCETTTGEPCKGFRYHQGKCHHAALVLERESARKVHITPEGKEALPIDQKGHLNGSTQGFALLK